MPEPLLPTAVAVSSPPEFDFAFDPSLDQFNVGVGGFLALHPEFDAIATGALVFDQQDRLLLIQRAAHDSMPSRWEVPGGAADPDDKTVLHAAARELWEETGLVLKRLVRQVPLGPEGPDAAVFFTRRNLRIGKFTFESEVEGCGGSSVIKLDPNEHQHCLWVTEDECRARRTGGNVEITFTTVQQEQTILEGFRMRRKQPQCP
ncbi:uncharacterized protein E0L32_006452 [Thyridium curvatum]|uniref:Nudix hydrolase domain-containing protein n=1 Tax=Thyridium curvatum TaxID=1093900 RepID=A0A507B1U1_9PEZI|nr:uncharacterized protein E0L32_006452 [Thyridium curvatum]TPX13026.1 hypothetical protein E0L32_006452 [Thyridium curvatum]